MSYTFKQNMVSSNKYSIKCPYPMTPKYIVCHNTSNDASAANEVSYMIRNNHQVSYHIAVDDKEAIQALPFDRNAWHTGDGANGPGNRHGIGVEICYSLSGGPRYTQAEENAVYVMARLLYQYNLPISALKQHANFANKNCPHRIRDEGRWESVRGRVEWVLEEIKKGNIEASLSSGTTALKATTNAGHAGNKGANKAPHRKPKKDNVKTKACERKVRALCDVNIWDGTDYQTVVGHIKKGEVIYFNQITEDELFGKLGDNQYISLDYHLFLMWDLWAAPIAKLEIMVPQLNAWSGPSYESEVSDHVKQYEVFEFTEERNGLALVNGIGWITLDPQMVKRFDLDKIASTYRL